MTTAVVPSIVYVLPDKLGGVSNIVANLLRHRAPSACAHHTIRTRNRLDTDTLGEPLGADRDVTFEYTLPIENLHAVLRRLAATLPPGPGVLVSNDWIELAMCCCADPGRTVIQIVHGDYDYYYDLATKHENVIDAYVAYSRRVYQQLLDLLPHRHSTIFHLPYGIEVPTRVRQPVRGPLRLLFAARLAEEKGIFDLPAIDKALIRGGVDVMWTVVGDGPGRDAFLKRWDLPAHVQLLGSRSNADVLALCAQHDVFVLPTRFEGFPVALLEAMGAGLVPVVSDLPSGIPEVIEPGVTGFRPAVADSAGFAAAIATLDRNRDQLETMSRAARQVVVERFDIRARIAGYEALYARWRELRRPRPQQMALPYGSRLDQAWLPNAAVYAVRATQRWVRGKTKRAET